MKDRLGVIESAKRRFAPPPYKGTFAEVWDTQVVKDQLPQTPKLEVVKPVLSLAEQIEQSEALIADLTEQSSGWQRFPGQVAKALKEEQVHLTELKAEVQRRSVKIWNQRRKH